MINPSYLSATLQTTAYRILREHVYAVLGKHHLTPTTWSLLGIIAEAKNGIRHTEIANKLYMKPPQVTHIVQQLQAEGVVTSVANQFDGRAKLLVLTNKGKRFVRRTEEEMRVQLGTLLDGLTENDMVIYDKVLRTIVMNDEIMRKLHS